MRARHFLISWRAEKIGTFSYGDMLTTNPSGQFPRHNYLVNKIILEAENRGVYFSQDQVIILNIFEFKSTEDFLNYTEL